MADVQDSPAFRRVVVAFDASPHGRALLELAGELALCFEASLSGLFIEQEGVLDYASLPNAQEVSLTSARLRPLTRARMEAHCLAQARLARRLFETMTARRRMPSSFTAHRGDPAGAVPLFSSRTDLLLLSPHVGFLAKPSAKDLLESLKAGTISGLVSPARPGQGLRKGPVVALLDSDLSHATPILSATRALARLPATGRGLVVRVGVQDEDAARREIGDLDSSAEPLPVHLVADRTALQSLLADFRPALLVVPDELSEDLREDLVRQGHALLVVRR